MFSITDENVTVKNYGFSWIKLLWMIIVGVFQSFLSYDLGRTHPCGSSWTEKYSILLNMDLYIVKNIFKY